MPEQNESIDVAEETMAGDLMSFLRDELKAAPDVWQKMSEEQQENVIYRAENRVLTAVKKAVQIIASADRPTISATVESVTVKDGIKAVLTLPKYDAQRHELFDAAGSSVLLVVASAEPFAGGTGDVKADPDQPALNGFGENEKAEATA